MTHRLLASHVHLICHLGRSVALSVSQLLAICGASKARSLILLANRCAICDALRKTFKLVGIKGLASAGPFFIWGAKQLSPILPSGVVHDELVITIALMFFRFIAR